MRTSAWFWLAVPFVVVGCAGILGIEDTSEASGDAGTGGIGGNDASTGGISGTGSTGGSGGTAGGGAGGTGGVGPCDAGSFDVGVVADAKAVPGGSVDVDISVTKNACLDAAIDVALVTPPIGITASALSIASTETTGKLTLTLGAGVPFGTVTLNLTATGGGVSRNFDMQLLVAGVPGSVDTTFTTFESAGGMVKALGVQPDGRIVVGLNPATGTGWALERLQPDGAVESGFTPTMPTTGALSDVAIGPSGSIAVTGNVLTDSGGAVVALGAGGNPNPLYGSNGIYLVPAVSLTDPIMPLGVAVQSDDKILFAGYRDDGGNDDPGLLVRLDPAASSPPPPGKVEWSKIWGDSTLSVVIPTTTGAIVGGVRNGSVLLSAAKLDGSLDPTFGDANGETLYAPGRVPSHLVSDGGLGGPGIFLCGSAATPTGSQPAVFFFDADGKNPSSALENPPEGYNYVYRGCAKTPDGKIVAVGSGGTSASGIRTVVSRFNADGTLDTTFSPGSSPPGHYVFQLVGNTSLHAIAVQADGRIVVGGSNVQSGAIVIRLWG
jgi:uncharacterized delta-60 repeat protein